MQRPSGRELQPAGGGDPRPRLPARLRRETAPLHQALEEVLGLAAADLTAAHYVFCLSRFWGIYGPLEQRIRSLDGWAAAGLDDGRWLKGEWLAGDLQALGVPLDRLEVCPALPALTTRAEAFGAMYVLEGSTLGGAVLARLVGARLGLTPGTGARFYHGYGDETGLRWQAFTAALDGFARAAADQGGGARVMEGIVGGARATFAAFLAWCGPAGARTPAARASSPAG